MMNEYECCAAVGGVEDQNEKEIYMLECSTRIIIFILTL